MIKLDRMADKSVENIFIGLNESKKIPYERVLFALGIRYVGQTVSKNLAKKFKSIDDLISKSYEELIEVDEIGERIAESVVNFFNDDKNLKIIERLKCVGLQFNLQKLDKVINIFEGKTFVVSGVFNSYSRSELKSLIESYGGKKPKHCKFKD